MSEVVSPAEDKIMNAIFSRDLLQGQ